MKFWLGLLLGLLFLTKGATQPHQTLTPALIHSYAQIGKTWGFLKYYHPQVAQGTLNWDQALVDALQSAGKRSPQAMGRHVVHHLLTLAGPVEDCHACLDQDDSAYTQTVNWSWLNDTTYVSTDQASFLRRIRDQRDAKDSVHRHYIRAWKGGSFQFTMDSAYQEIEAFTSAERLLPLFHYWNVIEYFFPYKPSVYPNWDQVLIEFIPKFWNAKGERALHFTMWELSSQLKDSHGSGGSRYLYEHGYGKYWLPFWARVSEDGGVFITQSRSDSVFQASQLQVGDQILQINGQAIERLLEAKRPSVAASNSTARDIYALWKILQDTLPWAELTLKRNEEVWVQRVARQEPAQFRARERPTWYWADSAQEILVVQNRQIRHPKQA
ncbi:MAG: PDZ domain-containing protein, partial [Bacteroidota bacterium]